jgi:hypothetical protein
MSQCRHYAPSKVRKTRTIVIAFFFALIVLLGACFAFASSVPPRKAGGGTPANPNGSTLGWASACAWRFESDKRGRMVEKRTSLA